MKEYIAFGLAALTLVACDGNPVAVYGPGGGTVDDGSVPVEPPIIDEATSTCGSSSFICTSDIEDVSVNDDGTVVVIKGTPFDETPLGGTFVPASEVNNAALGYDYNNDQLNGFSAYENDDPDRLSPYLAIVAESEDGSITVGTVSVMAGYNDYGYNGSFIRPNVSADLPGQGLVQYSGEYAGIVTLSGSTETYTSQGNVFIELDYVDEKLRGRTEGRTINGAPASEANGDIFFNDTNIDTEYTGTAGNSVNGIEQWSGSYQGVIAGDGTTTGGIFQVVDDDWLGNEFISAQETGVFIATTPDLE